MRFMRSVTAGSLLEPTQLGIRARATFRETALERSRMMPDTRAAIVRRGLRLNYATIAYNTAEAVVSLVAGLVAGSVALNALLGWWWADPVAALAMTPIIVKEGLEGIRGDACDDDGR